MSTLTSQDIRKSWIDFFAKKHGHKHCPSSSLIPDNPTLLLTGAGMVQFVPYFLGLKEPDFKRAVTIQKCTRVGGKDSDLENIGRTSRHHSFFEMLGNFSFGDYFKKDAIHWAWDYVTNILGLPEEKLYVSIFEGDSITPLDEEAYKIWKNEIKIKENKIRKLPRKEVFWGPPGPTGPCGPCSEIYFDRGENFKDNDERFLEIWNLVFMQFEKDEEGKFKPLLKKNIDTGAGLERIALILQNKKNTFETDLLKPILDNVSDITSTSYGMSQEKDLSLKIITDHIRCISFLTADGVRPSNLGRGYVLRMLIRRAARFGWLLGKKEPFLYNLPKVVSDNYSLVYPELLKNLSVIIDVVKKEEERFSETIERGLIVLDDLILKSGNIISGEEAFDLYSTYGFPLELTMDIVKEKNKNIDLQTFEKAKEKHSEVSNKDIFSVKLTDKKIYGDLLKEFKETKFLGYEKETCESIVLGIINSDGKKIESLKEGEKGEIILNETVFYAESGGQVGDTGIIKNKNCEIIVADTKKHEGLYIHSIKIKSGEIKIKDKVICEINVLKRKQTMHHHSVTHLMHAVLRNIFGNSLQQAGSEVSHERTRFDFTLDRAVSPDEKEDIEDTVNNWINKKLPVEIKEMSFDEALKTGALAFFGDKYGDRVRVIKMGDEREIASVELCGGTHVKNTSEIEKFKIIKESSISAGTRRIEAIAGKVAKDYMEKIEKEKKETLNKLIQEDKELEKEFIKLNLKSEWDKLSGIYSNEISALTEKHQKAKNTLLKNKVSEYSSKLKTFENNFEILSNGISLLKLKLEDFPDDAIKSFIEGKIKSSKKSVFIFANIQEKTKLQFFSGVTEDLILSGIKAKDLVNKVAEIAGGKGGGKDSFAQAGGKDISKVDEALEISYSIISR